MASPCRRPPRPGQAQSTTRPRRYSSQREEAVARRVVGYVLLPHTATRPGTYEAVTAVLPLEPAIDGRDLGRAVEHRSSSSFASSTSSNSGPGSGSGISFVFSSEATSRPHRKRFHDCGKAGAAGACPVFAAKCRKLLSSAVVSHPDEIE